VKNKCSKEDDDFDEKNMSLMIKKYANFMKSKGKGHHKRYRNESQNFVSNFNCYGRGETSHVKADCPNAKKGKEKKGKNVFKKKKWKDNNSSSSSSSSNSSESDEESNLCLIADHDSSDSEVSSYSNDNDYDSLYDAFQQLLYKSSKLDVAHKKIKSDFKDLQSKFEKSLEEEEVLKNKISILENKETEIIECASCKSYMFDLNILEKQLEDAL